MSERTPEEITAALAEPFPRELLEQKQGKTYVAAEHVRMRLIEATGNRWDFAIQSVEYRNDGALRDRENRNTGEIIAAPPVCVVTGSLTIPGLGTRSDTGVQEMESGSGADAAYKGAVSDCLKRCAMNFGVGLKQLYIDGGKPSAPERAPRQPRQEPAAKPATAPAVVMTDEQFLAALKKAIAEGDNKQLLQVISAADTDVSRWQAMATYSNTIPVLEWIGRKAEALDMAVPGVTDAIGIRRKELTEATA